MISVKTQICPEILGANFDDNGELRVWWQPDTRNFFESKKQCFIAQYDSKTNPFTDKKVKICIKQNFLAGWEKNPAGKYRG